MRFWRFPCRVYAAGRGHAESPSGGVQPLEEESRDLEEESRGRLMSAGRVSASSIPPDAASSI
jgi:hypothetical protein